MEQAATLWLIDNAAREMKRIAEHGMTVLVYLKVWPRCAERDAPYVVYNELTDETTLLNMFRC